MTSDFGVACGRECQVSPARLVIKLQGGRTLVKILLQSSISTLNVDAFAKMKSLAPMRE